MNRREFIAARKPEVFFKKTPSPQPGSGSSRTGITPYSGQWTRREVQHLLRRTMFGLKKSDVDYFLSTNLTQAVDELLIPSVNPPSPPVNTYNNANYTDPNVPFGQTWVNAPFDIEAIGRRQESLRAWWLGLMLNQSRSIEEKMVLFWHNHFATEMREYNDARFGYKHLVTLRQYALGNFKQLVKAITIDPAMLRYLNGYLNTKNAPDENYARELQELFTLGKGPNSQFTEDDVREAARVLTGFRLSPTAVTYFFDPSKHDTGDKQFSAFFNYMQIGGKSGLAGETELDDLLNMIFANDEVALYMCRKLYRFFVYHEINASVEANVIAPLADIFRSNNYEIKPVLEALFKSEHFFDACSIGSLIKAPVDMMIGFCRETNITFPGPGDVQGQYLMWGGISLATFLMQQSVLDPPSVSGWPAYYQEPVYHKIWINSVTLPYRNQFTDLLNYVGYTVQGRTVKVDAFEFAKQFSDPSDPDILLDEMLEFIYQVPASAQLKAYLKAILLSGQTLNFYWTQAWVAYENDPTNVMKQQTVLLRLLPVLIYVFDLPEYQLS